MSLNGQVCIAGAFEHPTRLAPDKSLAQLHAEVALGAIKDAGISKEDIDGFFCSTSSPGLGPLSMVDYLNLDVKHFDATESGGCSYLAHVAHAAAAISHGKCNIALVTLAGKPRSSGQTILGAFGNSDQPDRQWEYPYGVAVTNAYAMSARRHMHEFQTTSEQLAWIKVAASHHAQHNENAMLRQVVTVEDVVNSPLIASPLHRLDCCVITDGGGALIVTRPEIARSLNRPVITLRGAGEAIKGQAGGGIDLTHSAAAVSGPIAFSEAHVRPADIKYVSIYDSFTITVLVQLEDLGFCEHGRGGAFVSDGNLISGVGKLPFNTDGGGLCNNHPANRGGMTKIIEAVRQLRGEAHPAVQVKNCDLALVNGIGGSLGTRHASVTLILERE